MARDLNANRAELEDTPQGEAISDDLVAAGPMDMGVNFLPRHNPWFQDRCTLSICRDGREVQSQTDYILGTYYRLFQYVTFQYPRHHSDHYMVLGCLRGYPAK